VVQMGFLARHHLGTYTHRGKKKQKVGQMFNRLIFLLEFLFFFFFKNWWRWSRRISLIPWSISQPFPSATSIKSPTPSS
jgi:hypothetical protein